MSFSESDPFNHLELRIEGERYWWECESCGGDGLRAEQRRRSGFVGWKATEPIAQVLESWRGHLKVSHPHIWKRAQPVHCRYCGKRIAQYGDGGYWVDVDGSAKCLHSPTSPRDTLATFVSHSPPEETEE